MYKLGWFSTGRGQGSRNLLKAVRESIDSGETEAEIAFVFCSRDYGETEATDVFLRMVEDYGIPLVTFSYQKFKAAVIHRDISRPDILPRWRLAYDREVMRRLQHFKPDLCVLAGYMLVVGPEMCRKYDMINLHPAAPGGPAGTWQEVIWKLIETGASRTGAMMHLVTPELDRGPVVTYCSFSIRGGPFDRYWEEIRGRSLALVRREEGEKNRLFQLIRRHGAARELPLVTATIRAFSRGEIRINPDKRVVDAAGKPVNGYDLTDEVNRKVADRI